jgi:putative tryptophan/tyrosine transport system substrate-binding protein
MEAHAPNAFEGALAAMARGGTDVLLLMDVPIWARNRYRLPTMASTRFFAKSALLMSYGMSVCELWQHSAAYVDKLLKDAKPADLPVEQP